MGAEGVERAGHGGVHDLARHREPGIAHPRRRRAQELVGPALPLVQRRQRRAEAGSAAVAAEHVVAGGDRRHAEVEGALDGIEHGVVGDRVVRVVGLPRQGRGDGQAVELAVVVHAEGGVGVAGAVVVLQVDEIAEAAQGMAFGGRELQARRMGVAVPVARLHAALGAEDAVHVVDVAVVEAGALGLALNAQGVVGLLVVPPRHAAEEALAAVVDALPAGGDREAVVVVAQMRLVEIESLRIGDDRILGSPVDQGVEVLDAQYQGVVRFEADAQASVLGRREGEPRLAGGCGGVFVHAVLIDGFQAVAKGEVRLAVGDRLAPVGDGRRCADRQGETG